MKTFTYTITDPIGIHARPAGLLAKELRKYDALVTVTKADKTADAKKLISLMGMGIKCGDTVTVKVEGADEETAAAAVEAFLKENL